ncbi:MAG: hypothetical protein ACXABV_15420 [Candidatus Thorarchaeota archaeon]
MKDYLYRLIGKGLVISGVGLLLFSIPIIGFSIVFRYSGEIGPTTADVFSLMMSFLVGITITYSGVRVLGSIEERIPFFTKVGKPIHSGKTWKRGSESGLYATSCGLVLSTNQESRDTAHIGYRVVYANQATCGDCIAIEGKLAMGGSPLRRSY